MNLVANHPDRNVIRVQLRQNLMLKHLAAEEVMALESHLAIEDYRKGDCLLHQGALDMEQYFLVEGVLKRVVANAQGKEMILRFAHEGDMETSYAAWRLNTPAPYSIMAVTRARVARLSLPHWAEFLERHAHVKEVFEFEVMRHMSEIMAHIITLHLLDAPGRVHRFQRKHPEFTERLPKKELASYLNLCAETLSRLQHQGKIHLK